MVSELWVDTYVVSSLLDDEYARQTPIETNNETRSTNPPCEGCDASEATVYRRLERLQQELVESVQEIDLKEGFTRCTRHVSICLRSQVRD